MHSKNTRNKDYRKKFSQFVTSCISYVDMHIQDGGLEQNFK